MVLLLESASETECGPDIPGLRTLVTSGEQDDPRVAVLLEIHSVPRSVVEPQFRDTFTDRPYVTGIPPGQTFDPGLNASSRSQIPKVVEPLRKALGLTNLDHIEV
jgi:hypothetical protein